MRIFRADQHYNFTHRHTIIGNTEFFKVKLHSYINLITHPVTAQIQILLYHLQYIRSH